MKNILIALSFILFLSQNAFSQDEIPLSDYSVKIQGTWVLLDINEEGGFVPSNTVYEFSNYQSVYIRMKDRNPETRGYRLGAIGGGGRKDEATILFVNFVSEDYNEEYSYYIHYVDSELYMVFENNINEKRMVFKKQK